jgi:hypothetical protein
MRLVLLTLTALICCGVAQAAEPNRLPEGKPPSFWSKLLGRTPGGAQGTDHNSGFRQTGDPRPWPPVARQTPPERQAKSQGKSKGAVVDPNVDRASYEEPEKPVMMPPVQPKKSALAPLTSWLRRPKKTSRSMSEYMTEERP